jgi:hypothetical protein
MVSSQKGTVPDVDEILLLREVSPRAWNASRRGYVNAWLSRENAAGQSQPVQIVACIVPRDDPDFL